MMTGKVATEDVSADGVVDAVSPLEAVVCSASVVEGPNILYPEPKIPTTAVYKITMRKIIVTSNATILSISCETLFDLFFFGDDFDLFVLP